MPSLRNDRGDVADGVGAGDVCGNCPAVGGVEQCLVLGAGAYGAVHENATGGGSATICEARLQIRCVISVCKCWSEARGLLEEGEHQVVGDVVFL